jgi:hypothetical protein
MTAIADFSVAVLDCQACARRFIQSYVSLAKHADRVACPHCGAHYGSEEPFDEAPDGAGHETAPVRPARSRTHAWLHISGSRRRRLQ